MNDYEAKRQARIDRLHARAQAKRAAGEATIDRARKMADIIPLGQPILIGHHSEGRDRRYRERISRGFDRGFEALKEAGDLERRAAAAERNDAVSSSDDPEAVAKLKEQIATIEAEQVRSKKINAAIRAAWSKAKREGLTDEQRLDDVVLALGALGVPPTLAAKLATPDCMGYTGVPGYRLSNAGANVRRLKQRIEVIERNATSEGRTAEFGDVRVEWRDNRVRVHFPGKPIAEVRARLKGGGFRWAPSEGAWQAHANEYAWQCAVEIAGKP